MLNGYSEFVTYRCLCGNRYLFILGNYPHETYIRVTKQRYCTGCKRAIPSTMPAAQNIDPVEPFPRTETLRP